MVTFLIVWFDLALPDSLFEIPIRKQAPDKRGRIDIFQENKRLNDEDKIDPQRDETAIWSGR